jgi:poly(A) polymerase
VRDLLLGRTPKDYDIATAARPQQVKRVFPRNCRIIGRRFKLAHLHFHGNSKILECSTFRRSPPPAENGDDVLITRDNEFGTAEEDALRRDFTVNALFLDPTRDTILDYANGLQDLRDRVIRTIGDPHVRFREDPVRILRAAKFAGRLGFEVEPTTFQAMCDTSGDLVRSAPPRLLEEILRLLRSGHALDSFQLLRDVGAMQSLLPVVADHLAAAPHDERVDFWRLLQALDDRVLDRGAPPNGVLLGVLFAQPVAAAAARRPDRSPSSIAEDLLGPFCATLRLPRRDAGCLKRICGVQHRFAQLDEEKRFRTEGFVQGPYFAEALELFELRSIAEGRDLSLVDRWYALADEFAGGHDGPDDRDDGRRDDPHEAAEAGDRQDGDGPVRGELESDEPHAEADERPTGADDVEPADDGTTNPWAQPTEPGRRRRRRRRRRGRGRHRDDEAAAADDMPPDLGPPDDAPPSIRTPRIAAEAEPVEPGFDGDAPLPDVDDDALREPAAAADDDAAAPNDSGPAPGGRRRRRRRRGRRGRGAAGASPFPASEAPAPHGEAVDAEHRQHEVLERTGPLPDPNAPDAADEPLDGDAAAGGTAGPGVDDGEGERRGRRRRRRRRGRGRGQQPDGGAAPAPEPPRHRPADSGPRRDRSQERRRSGHGAPRDVDVVPRYRDRRGKVDVIEPATFDLSAFDAELDPKRVPTFGSIVEGKGRPKRRGPRVPDDGVDDYRPPPPPGHDTGPAAPPPPPTDAPDTFGDW